MKEPYRPRAALALDEDMAEAMRKMEIEEAVAKRLPGLDCGSCGAPNCRALAEDVARGEAKEMDCIFLLKEKVRQLAEQMVELSRKDIFKQ